MNRLYKSNKDKVFDGVCGGVGEYFNIDPVIIRLLWVVFVIFGGTGVLAYVLAMLIIPKNPEFQENKGSSETAIETDSYSQKFWGGLLVIAGFLLLVGLIGPVGGIFAGVAIVMSSVLWPLLVIGAGLYLFFNQSDNKNVKTTLNQVFPQDKKLYRSRTDKRIAGVCGGIGIYLKIDSNIIRFIWALATLGSFGLGVLVYLALAVFLTESN